MLRAVDAEAGERAQRRLLQCTKSLEYIVRVVARSRELRVALPDPERRGEATASFVRDVHALLDAFALLMRAGDAALLGQGSCLKYLPAAAPHLVRVLPTRTVAAGVASVLAALPWRRLATQRALALLELARGVLLAEPAGRDHLLPALSASLRRLLSDHHEVRDLSSRSGTVPRSRLSRLESFDESGNE